MQIILKEMLLWRNKARTIFATIVQTFQMCELSLGHAITFDLCSKPIALLRYLTTRNQLLHPLHPKNFKHFVHDENINV